MRNQNNVNLLDGKNWLRNAVNFWIMDSDDIDAIAERIKSFCYKDRTGAGCFDNLNGNGTVQSSDFSFNYVKTLHDAETAAANILSGRKKSYHAVFLENEFIEGVFIFPYFTKNLVRYDIEYRGKIIVANSENDTIYYILLFLKNGEECIIADAAIAETPIKSDLEDPYIIESKSKMDKIGLKHPAPFSYIDINKICLKNNIADKIILDPFLGVGSTIIGTYKNNRILGIELNPEYVDLTYKRLELLGIKEEALKNSAIVCGDSLEEIKKLNASIDVVITSPPYFNILKNNTSGVRTDSSQSRQGVEYYSDDSKDIANCANYPEYLQAMEKLFVDINKIMTDEGEVYLIISDFTINKKETDIHSDCVKLMNDAGYVYCGTSYILQNQKAIYPFGYPYKIVLNHIYQYIIKFRKGI